MTRRLDGKAAVISGASRGLGRAVARNFLSRGATVFLLARNEKMLQQVASDLGDTGGRLSTFACDVSNPHDVASARDAILSTMGRVDIVVSNAGIPGPRDLEQTSNEEWDTIIGVNLSGPFYLIRALWEPLKESGEGYLISISGGNGKRGGPSASYASSKFGLTGLGMAAGIAGKEHGIRVTTLYPGSMDTGWRGTEIGRPRKESMSPDDVADFIGYLVTTPPEFVVNEAVLNPIGDPWA